MHGEHGCDESGDSVGCAAGVRGFAGRVGLVGGDQGKTGRGRKGNYVSEEREAMASKSLRSFDSKAEPEE